MNIPKLIKEAHENAVEKGFYDCPECNGDCFTIEGGAEIGHDAEGNEIQIDGRYQSQCKQCNGTGINPNKNIGELLMLIVSELGEALEAHRKGLFACTGNNHVNVENCLPPKNKDSFYETLECYITGFEKHIKDTFEDEIADVFIRLFDLCGYLGIEPDKEVLTSVPKIQKNVAQCLLRLSYEISSMDSNGQYMNGYLNENNYGFIFAYLREFCNVNNIPIEKHIEAKMEYNKTRPHKHGKQY